MPITDLPSYPRIATLLTSYITAVEDAQADYFANNQKYFQGLDIVDGEPDGVTNANANTTGKPSDQETSWRDFDPVVFAAGTALPLNMRSEVYESPFGWGYRLIFEFWRDGLGPDDFGIDGRHWVYVHHVGPKAPKVREGVWYIENEGV